MASVGFWLQRHGRRLVVIVPFVWLLLFFLAPFLIVLKLSFSEPVLAQPPYAPLLELAEEAGNTYLRVQLNLSKLGIPFTHVDASDSVGGWKARDIPWLGLITLGRFRSSTRGLAAKRRVVSISGGCAGRMALSVPTA